MNQKLKIWFPFLALIFCLQTLYSQVVYEPLNYSLRSFNQYSQDYIRDDEKRQSSFYPNLSSDINGENGQYYRSYIPVNQKDSSFLLRKRYKERSFIRRKTLMENLVTIDTGLLYITIDPLMNFSGGIEKYDAQNNPAGVQNRNLFNNTRGLMVRADIGKKFSLETYAYENQATLPYYISEYVDASGVVPGQGRVKNFYTNAYDFSQAGAYFSYAPFKNFNVQFGHHKHFIGDGYRSFILSDNSFNYPFLRYNMWFWKNRISYSVMYTSFQDLNRLPNANTAEATFQRKGGSFYVLEYRATDWIKFSLYQGSVWRTMNYDGSNTGDYTMFYPIMFLGTATGNTTNHDGIFGAGALVPVHWLNLFLNYPSIHQYIEAYTKWKNSVDKSVLIIS